MARDLHEFVKQIEAMFPDDFVRSREREREREVDPSNFDVAAILQHFENRKEEPMVLFERPLNLRGEASGIAILVNVFAERKRCAIALDLDPAQANLPLSLGYSELGRHSIPPVVIPSEEAPVKEILRTGTDIDTRDLPIVIHSEGDYGPCLTMALAVRDPMSGAYNASFIKAFYDFEDNRRLRITIHSPDSERVLRHYEERDLPMPIVAILGHHPAFFLATTGQTAFESDDYEVIGGFLREPLRLVPSETWGDDFLVPADAEILVEGEVPPGVRMIADPFGDIITAVHYPYSGCGRLAVYVSIRKTKEGQAKSVAVAAVLESRLCEVAVVVDDVIDVFYEPDVIWATLVNADPSRDVDLIHNTMPNSFTLAMGYKKLVIDATRPLDRPMPEMNRVPKDALDRVDLSDYMKRAK